MQGFPGPLSLGVVRAERGLKVIDRRASGLARIREITAGLVEAIDLR